MVDVKEYFNNAENKMSSTIKILDDTLAQIRAGKANPRILDGIRIDYYGTPTPLSGVATISTPDGKTIAIQPWEKQLIKEIEKALMASDIGITPENNGEVIRLNIPPLTEERRKSLVKQVRHEAEATKISIRNIRRDIIDSLKKAVKEKLPEDVEKDAEAEIQKKHDKFVKKIDEIVAAKEKEIMTV